MAATLPSAKLRPKRKSRRGPVQQPIPKERKCPDCEFEIAISRIPTDLVAHLRSAHNRSPNFDELNQFVPPKKLPKTPRAKKKRPKVSKSKMIYVDRSIFSKKGNSPRTPEQQQAQDRINSRGFHEGAKVPGSSVRKIDK